MASRPIVTVTGPKGGDLVARFGPAIASITVSDRAGYENDECEIRIRCTPPFPKGPAVKTLYTVKARWSEGGPAGEYVGLFSVQRIGFSGDAETGYEMVVVCRSADFSDALMKAATQHFDDTTVKAIVQKVAKAAGYEAVVDPTIGAIKIRYRLRHEQSAIDFLTDLVTPFGGAVKVAGGKLIVTARGDGSSASGKAMGDITVTLGEDLEIDIDLDERGVYAEATSSRHDPRTGRPVRETDRGSSGGGRSSTLHPSASEDEAKAHAKARRREEMRRSCQGGITLRGRPTAQQGMRVVLSGYGPDLDKADMVAAEVVHTFDPANDGWRTEIGVERRTKDA